VSAPERTPSGRSHPSIPRRKTRSIYVHVPFCARRCPYCDFSIAVPRDGVEPAAFLKALAVELGVLPYKLAPRTLYLGGGTPTELGPAFLLDLLRELEAWIDRSRLVEFTVEANPENVTADIARCLADSGANRVSLGAQSFAAGNLRFLGRRHTSDDILRSVDLLRSAGISRISVDLIFGLPDQTVDDLGQDLRRLVALEPDHISTYCLAYEEYTPLTLALERGLTTRKSSEEELELYRHVRAMLVRFGFRQYEISSFARPGKASLHNGGYWKHTEYLGVGPAAVSFIGGVRWKNAASTPDWITGQLTGNPQHEFIENLPTAGAAREAVITGLRRSRGIREGWLRRRLGVGFEVLDEAMIRSFREQGLLESKPGCLRLTERGVELADHVAAGIL